MTIIIRSFGEFLGDVWKEFFGTPVLSTVLIKIPPLEPDDRGVSWQRYRAVGFRAGLFSDVYEDLPTLLAQEPRYRRKFERFARKRGMTAKQLLGVS